MKKNQKQAIIITGAAQRLGLELTKKSLAMGYDVVAHFRTSADQLCQWLKHHSEFESHVFCIGMDLIDKPEMLIERALSLPIKIIGLVNNASVFLPGDLTDSSNYKHHMAINAEVPLSLANYFYKTIGKGWIVNMADAHCPISSHKYQNYRISKQMLAEITKQMAFRFAPKVRVNAIAPGAMLPAHQESKVFFETLKKVIPLKRTGDIESLLKAYCYLIENEYVTGDVLHVDGGWHLVS